MRDALVLELADAGREDLEVAGGKGANLGELVRMGMNVPAGFVVTTAAYEQFVKQNGLQGPIEGMLSAADGAIPSGAEIQEALGGGVMPRVVEECILEAYDRLGGGAVAVRSSATAEDLPQAAFAGQQDTFLNVVGAQALLEATRRCWASLWTERAIAYREHQGMGQEKVSLAVVVQRMAAAEVAGVMFTANPVTGAREEVVIEASPGLGEAVVSGRVTPDHFVLRRQWGRWRITERRAGRREVIIRALPGGGTEDVVGTGVAEVEAMPDAALRRLGNLGAQIEAHYGAPQDVEWAWDGESLFILQARPMTALPEQPPKATKPVQLLSGVFAEMIPGRPYPLEATTWGPRLMWSAFVTPFFQLIGLKVTPIERLMVEEDGVIVAFSGELPARPTLRLLLAPFRLLRRARRYDPFQWKTDPLIGEALQRVRELEGRELQAFSWQELLKTVHEALAIPALLFELRFRYLPRGMLAAVLLRVMLALIGRGKQFGTLILPGVETKTLEANRAIEVLAARIRSQPALAEMFAAHEANELWAALDAQPQGREFLEELQAFLDEHGHREAGGTLALMEGTWREKPELVLGILKGLSGGEARRESGTAQWTAARDEVLAHPLLRLGPFRRAFLSHLRAARTFAQVREDTRYYATLILPVLRQTLLELGSRLESEGVLAHKEDVFHLRLEELERLDEKWPPQRTLIAELRAVVERRKKKRAMLARTPLIDPRLYRRTGQARDALLQGTPGSPGVAEGPVCIVRDGSEFGKLRPGDVLVAPYTNPAWTPLFQQAAAVVVDTGSAGSHAAITAREYGIPAVMATVDGSVRLKDGQRVTVDGGRGVVEGGD